MPESEFDIAIIGGGPAGCACALALKNSGLSVALFDKSIFPRDKVCGDAIPGRAIKVLKSISPDYAKKFSAFPHQLHTRTTEVHFENQVMEIEWVLDAYTCTRYEFDNFLLQLVLEETKTLVLQDEAINEISPKDQLFQLKSSKNNTYRAKLIIGADGVQGVTAPLLGRKQVDREYTAISVRAYYENVTELAPDRTYIYLHRDFLPTYLWAFPLPGHKANVGIGMNALEAKKRKMNLRNIFYEMVDKQTTVAGVLRGTKQTTPLEGYSIPLGSDRRKISGNGILLTGDAASLADPLSGDGIGNAMLSGKQAALQALRCFEQNNFSDSFIGQYDDAVFKAIGKELRLHHLIQKFVTLLPQVIPLAFSIYGNDWCKKIIRKLF